MSMVSVIVPIYNAEDTLDYCVKSILSQTFEDYELLLVDDGSPDNCPQLCDDYAKKDNRIKVIHKKTVGFRMPGMPESKWRPASISALLTVMTI